MADEIARNPYNTADERKAYKNRRTEIEKRRQAEIDAMQNKLKASYEKLAREQKTYYGLMVNRKIENSINTK